MAPLLAHTQSPPQTPADHSTATATDTVVSNCGEYSTVLRKLARLAAAISAAAEAIAAAACSFVWGRLAACAAHSVAEATLSPQQHPHRAEATAAAADSLTGRRYPLAASATAGAMSSKASRQAEVGRAAYW